MRVPATLAAAAASLVLSVSGAVLLPAAAAAGPAAVPAGEESLSPEADRTASGLENGDAVRVIATLKAPGGTGRKPDTAAIREARTDVLADLPTGGYEVVSAFSRIPAVSLEADLETLDALADDPRVLSVQVDHVVETTMTEANELTGANDVHDLGITGEGVTAAVIDTGVDSNAGVVHPGLADDLLGQACFRTEGDCINSTASAEDQNGHGTHVAGTITGPEGVAPDAEFYALKVFTTGSTTDTNILNALNHVIGLNTMTPGTVDLVNLSLGSANFATPAACDADSPAYQTAFATLNSQSVTIFASTGNDADIAGVGSPGCVSGAVGVGSTGDATFTATFNSCTDSGAVDKVSCFSNATPVQGDGELVDLLAPGCRIESTWLNNGTHTICGTSMATPYALGTAALAQEYAEDHDGKLSPTELETLLEATGVPLSDYRLPSGPTFPRVAPLKAIGSLATDSPTNLMVTGTTTSSVSLSWTGVAAAASYQVSRTAAASSTTTDLASAGSGTTYTDSTAACGPLTYTVQTVNAQGVPSQASNQVTTAARPCPASPGGVTLAKNDPDTHTVSWTTTGALANVVVQRRPFGGQFADHQVLGGAVLSYQDTVAACGLVEYRVVAVAANGDRSAPSAVVGRPVCAPANDDLADAAVISTSPYTSTVTQAQRATVQATDPAHPSSCIYDNSAARVGSHTLWWTITPEVSGGLDLDTLGSSGSHSDTLLSVLTGSPGAFTDLACDDDVDGVILRSSLQDVALTAGTTYYVLVSRWDSSATTTEGTAVLKASFTATPALQLSRTTAAVQEGQPGGTYTARLTAAPTADVTVTPAGTADCSAAPSALTFTAANWATPQTITITAPDEGLVEAPEQCTIGHSLTSADSTYNGLAAPVVTVTVTDAAAPPPPTPAAGRPDVRISSPAPLVGDDVYGGTAQKKVVKSAVGTRVTYTVSLQNDSTASDRLQVRGARSDKGFKIKYLAPDGTNITRAVVAGTYTTPSLAPGATFAIKVVVKLGKKAEKKLKAIVTATSVQTPSATDLVHLLTKRK